MHWSRCIENPQAIASLFEIPDDLSLVDLHEILAHREGPVVRLRFDVQAVPKAMPKKWPADANTTQILLAAWGVEALQLDGWGTSVRGQLSVATEGNRRVLNFTSEICQLKATCSFIRVEQVQGYVNHHDG